MNLSISFEVYPPSDRSACRELAEVVERLTVVDPAYVSVTYGAGGSSRERTFDAIEAIGTKGTEVAGHLTCVGQSRADVAAVIERYRQLGVTRVVALRGDPPSGIDGAYAAHPDGFGRTAELVAAVRAAGGMQVAVSAYPEVHPQSPSLAHDLDVLEAKVAAGASQAITQMFFDDDRFLRYREEVVSRGLPVELVPGIFPIHSFPAVQRFAQRCGATIPDHLADRFGGLDDDEATTHKIGAELAADQILHLAEHGVRSFHLYTLNRADLALAVCRRLGLTDRAAQ